MKPNMLIAETNRGNDPCPRTPTKARQNAVTLASMDKPAQITERYHARSDSDVRRGTAFTVPQKPRQVKQMRSPPAASARRDHTVHSFVDACIQIPLFENHGKFLRRIP